MIITQGRRVQCGYCNGTGETFNATHLKCAACNGYGKLTIYGGKVPCGTDDCTRF